MIYEEFKKTLHYPDVNSNDHIAIVINELPCSTDEFMVYFYENTQHVTTLFSTFSNGRMFLILNKDAIFGNEFVTYELVTDLPDVFAVIEESNEEQI